VVEARIVPSTRSLLYKNSPPNLRSPDLVPNPFLEQQNTLRVRRRWLQQRRWRRSRRTRASWCCGASTASSSRCRRPSRGSGLGSSWRRPRPVSEWSRSLATSPAASWRESSRTGRPEPPRRRGRSSTASSSPGCGTTTGWTSSARRTTCATPRSSTSSGSGPDRAYAS
jgi:hypothetical protein